jgi:hypothetical protein
MEMRSRIIIHYNADLDISSQCKADPDPDRLCADPDPAFHSSANPVPGPASQNNTGPILIRI